MCKTLKHVHIEWQGRRQPAWSPPQAELLTSTVLHIMTDFHQKYRFFPPSTGNQCVTKVNKNASILTLVVRCCLH